MKEKRLNIEFNTAYNFRFPFIQGVDFNSMLSNLHSNNKIFNKEKFRLHSFVSTEDSLFLKIGITNYFEYFLTNHNKQMYPLLKRMGMVLHKSRSHFLSNCIGNVGIIFLSDGSIVLPKRSKVVGTFNNIYDLPGGHPEPSSLTELTEDSIKKEFFNSIKYELFEEFNLEDSHIKSISFYNLILNKYDGNTPELVFLINSSHNSKEFAEISKKSLAKEHSDICFYDIHNTNFNKKIRITKFSQTLLSLIRKNNLFTQNIFLNDSF